MAKDLLFFCLEHFHPTESGRSAPLDDKSRYFVAKDVGCPECPKCEKQVSAAVVPDDKSLPQSVIDALRRAQNDLVNVMTTRSIPPPV